MSHIYCLVTKGNGLTQGIASLLFEECQEAMDNNERKRRFKLPEIGLTGEIRTSYKLGFIGTVAGIIFNTSVDWDNGSVQAEFIVRPLNDHHKHMGCGRWVNTPLFPSEESFDPKKN
jgi:hypothetical protein